MSKILGNGDDACAIIKAFGLDPSLTQYVRITIEIGKPILIDTREFLDSEKAHMAFKKYNVVPAE